ncbi:MAG: hypothetical protein Q9166_006281 [cf. Caloplaca sp. 2 TL-2023]
MLGYGEYEYGWRKGYGMTRKHKDHKSGATAGQAPSRSGSHKAVSSHHPYSDSESFSDDDAGLSPAMFQQDPPPPAYYQQQDAYYNNRPGPSQQAEVYYDNHPLSNRGSGPMGAYPGHPAGEYYGYENVQVQDFAQGTCRSGASRGHQPDARPGSARSGNHSGHQYESAHSHKCSSGSNSPSVKRSAYGSKRGAGLAPIHEGRPSHYLANGASAQQHYYDGKYPMQGRNRRTSAMMDEDPYGNQAPGHYPSRSRRTSAIMEEPQGSYVASHSTRQSKRSSAIIAPQGSRAGQYSIHNDFVSAKEVREAPRNKRDSGYFSGQPQHVSAKEKRHAKLIMGDRNVTLADF